ncbi:MAG: type IV pilus assembly protein PilM, partial [Candidatus Omnitrophota bacterium]|nr:type IV pilus assembly protein PilM [Candidatus Omnitrophota bacterium]
TIIGLGQNLPSVLKSPFTAVSGKGTLIRYIEMPEMSLPELRDAFAIEADKYFPFAQDQIYTDCYILESDPKRKKMQVMVAAAKKELIDERVKLLTELGSQVEFIGINPIALANALNVLGFGEKEKENKVIALLDLGDAVSNVTIFVNRLPRFTRDIYVGGRDFSKRISNALGLSLDEAEALKKNPGEKKEQMLNACESSIGNMVQELRLSFDYFENEKNSDITHLLLTGGGCMLEGLSEHLEKTLEIKTSCWNLVDLLRVAPHINVNDLNQKSFKLGVALGLALYQYD